MAENDPVEVGEEVLQFREISEEWEQQEDPNFYDNLEKSAASFTRAWNSVIDERRREAEMAALEKETVEGFVKGARFQLIDDKIDRYERLLDDIFLEADTPEWTKELIRRRRQQISELTASVRVYTSNGRKDYEVYYVGGGEFDDWEVNE